MKTEDVLNALLSATRTRPIALTQSNGRAFVPLAGQITSLEELANGKTRVRTTDGRSKTVEESLSAVQTLIDEPD